MKDVLINEPQYCRISDRFGGGPHNMVGKVMQYNFSNTYDSDDAKMDTNVMGNILQNMDQTSTGPMHG